MSKPRTHYATGMAHYLGWAICGLGPVYCTSNPKEVTCKRCLAILRRDIREPAAGMGRKREMRCCN